MCKNQPVSEDALGEDIVNGEQNGLNINVYLQSKSSGSESPILVSSALKTWRT